MAIMIELLARGCFGIGIILVIGSILLLTTDVGHQYIFGKCNRTLTSFGMSLLAGFFWAFAAMFSFTTSALTFLVIYTLVMLIIAIFIHVFFADSIIDNQQLILVM